VKEMKTKFVKEASILLITVILVSSTSALALQINQKSTDKVNIMLSGDIWYVPDDFSTIQQAIDNADDGDTIIVRSGTYNENIIIDKSIDLTGINKEDTIIEGSDVEFTIIINADDVEISEFTITKGGGGIYIEHCSEIRIEDNIITHNREIYSGGVGLLFYDSSRNKILNNIITEHNGGGIHIRSSEDMPSIENQIKNNVISDNKNGGLSLFSQDRQNLDGLNIITKNIISSNNGGGIIIYDSNYNHITENTFIDNTCGIEFITQTANYQSSSVGNEIIGNIFTDHYAEGIWIADFSKDNVIYDNEFIYNNPNARDDSPFHNQWYNINSDQGNYWDDYTGRDDDGDGIGDTPYWIAGGTTDSEGEEDDYPIFRPAEEGTPQIPSRPIGETNGEPYVEYEYSTSTVDPDGDRVKYGWDFDGDKQVDEWTGLHQSGKTVTITYEWYQQGTYNVQVRAEDETGKRSVWSEPLKVNMPRNRSITTLFIEKIIGRFPQLVQLLKLLNY
jgi:parallel beta-helix repeat protein